MNTFLNGLRNKEHTDLMTLSFCVFDVLFLCIGHSFSINILTYLALFIFLLMIMTCRNERFLPIMLFFLPFSLLMRVEADSYSFFTLGYFPAFIALYLKNQKSTIPYSKNNIVISIIIIIYSGIMIVINGQPFNNSYAMSMFLFLTIPLYLILVRQTISFKECSYYLIFGVIASCFLSLAFRNFDGMVNYIRIAATDVPDAYRICGFTQDGNRLAAQALSAMGCVWVLYLNEQRRNTGKYLILLLILIIVGVLSVSKMFLLLGAFLLIAWLITMMRYNEKAGEIPKIILYVILTAGIILSTGILDDQINIYVRRMDIITNMTTFSTNRSDVWIYYLQYLLGNLDALLLGKGWTTNYLFIPQLWQKVPPHNVIIEVVYRVGIIGFLLIITWLRTEVSIIHVKSKTNSSYWEQFFIILTSIFASWFAIPTLDFDEFFYMPLLAIIAINYIKVSLNKENGGNTPI